ncbi:MAG: ParB/RepB/Spo0J family partition protein, partial [Candidatus Bathyarchaeia archaeon]
MQATGTECVKIDISNIRNNRFKIRPLDEQTVANLMTSIQNIGLLQPISVRRVEGGFELIFGMHRLEACRRLGWKDISATIMEISEQESFLVQIAENLQRNQVINPVEEGRGYKELLNQGWTLTRIAKKIGMSDSYVFDRINLVDNLEPSLREKLEKNPKEFLSVSHAIRIASLKSKETQIELAKAVKKERLSVHQLERLIARYKLDKSHRHDIDFITEMYNTHPIWKWKDGFFEGPESRVCVLRADSLNLLLQFIGDKAYKAGQLCARSLRSLILRKLGNSQIDLKALINEFNKRTGFGF